MQDTELLLLVTAALSTIVLTIHGGGAIFAKSSLVIHHSSFMNNQVIRDGCGGTIYSVKFFINTISISINQSEFINNTIACEIGEGGAILYKRIQQ